MKALYLALIAQIKTVPAIKWIDLDAGQLESSESRAALKSPCALLRFSFMPSDVSEENDQRETGTVTVRLAFDATGSRTSADTPNTVLGRSLAWIDTADDVYNALQGFSTSDFEEMECTGRDQEPRSDGLVVWKMTFITARWLFKD